MAEIGETPRSPTCQQQHRLSSLLPSCGWCGQSKGRAETEGLLKFKWPGCCEDIFYLFWHLCCQQEWQRVHHSLAFSRAEGNGNLERFSWDIQSRGATESDGVMANVNEQAGQGSSISLHYQCPQGALIRETLQCVVRTSKKESILDMPRDNTLFHQVPNSHWKLWLWGSRPKFPGVGEPEKDQLQLWQCKTT